MLTFVPPHELGRVWPEIAAAVTRTAAKLNCAADVDDIRQSLEKRDAGLFMLDCGGFLVARHLHEGPRAIFHVWMLYSRTLKRRLPDVVAAVDRVARDMGCAVVRFQSPRKAWQRFPLFEETSVVYERKVPNV